MKEEHKIILWAIIGALIVWTVDAYFDYTVFYNDVHSTFIHMLITDVPLHEIYIRTVILVVFLLFLFIVAKRTSSLRRAEESARRERDLIEGLFQTAPSIIVVLDASGNIVNFNEYLAKILGRSLDEMKGKNWLDVIVPEDEKELIRAVHKDTLTGKDTRGTLNKITAKDGRELLVEWYNTVITDKDGNATGTLSVGQDVTVARLSAEKINEQNEFLTQILESLSHPFYVVNVKDYEVTLANSASRLGESLNGGKCYKLTHLRDEPCSGDDHPCPLEIVRETRKPIVVEHVHYDKNNKARNVEIHASPVFDEIGDVERIIEYCIDVTEKKKAEHALRESEERFRSQIEQTPVGIVIYNPDGTPSYVNPAQKKIIATDEETFRLFKEHYNILQDEHLIEAGIMPYVQRGFAGETLQFPDILHKPAEMGIPGVKDSEPIWLRAFSFPIRDTAGEIREVVITFENITEIRKVEESLKVTQFSVDHSSDAVYWIKPDGKFFYVNETACQSHGYTKEELLGKSVPDIAPEFPPNAWARFWEELAEKGSYTQESMHKRKDGAVFPVEIRLNFIQFAGEEYACGFVSDISERKEQEENKRKVDAQMQHMQKLESLSSMAGGIAHDFNNLLVAILGYSELAQLELDPESPSVDHVRQIEKQAIHAADLTKQLLAYSGKGKFVVETLDLGKVVEEMEHLLKAAVSKKVVLKCKLDKDIPPIDGDATQTRQVILNLVTNASEAIGDKSGIVSIATGVMECTREYFLGTYLRQDIPPGFYSYIEVSDTGCGMDNETKQRIFDPFYSTKFTGRGLGMAAVLGIVRGHRGTIKLYTEPGGGSSFKVLFPISQEKVGAAKTPLEEEYKDWKGSGTVLVVDDEESIRTIAKNTLESAGFNVVSAEDGLDGLEKFREHSGEIVLVLLDMTMPHMDGDEAYREIRLIDQSVPVLLSSGYNEQDATSHFAGKGLAGFIQKPYKPSALITKIRRILTSQDSTEEES